MKIDVIMCSREDFLSAALAAQNGERSELVKDGEVIATIEPLPENMTVTGHGSFRLPSLGVNNG